MLWFCGWPLPFFFTFPKRYHFDLILFSVSFRDTFSNKQNSLFFPKLPSVVCELGVEATAYFVFGHDPAGARPESSTCTPVWHSSTHSCHRARHCRSMSASSSLGASLLLITNNISTSCLEGDSDANTHDDDWTGPALTLLTLFLVVGTRALTLRNYRNSMFAALRREWLFLRREWLFLRLSLGILCVGTSKTASADVAFLLPAHGAALCLPRCLAFTLTDYKSGRTFHKARTSPLSAGPGNSDLEDWKDMQTFNQKSYVELRKRFAVARETPSVNGKQGRLENFSYVPPSMQEREDVLTPMPSPTLTAQEAISTILSAMKANRSFGCRIYLRFASDRNKYGQLPHAEDLKLALEESDHLQVLIFAWASNWLSIALCLIASITRVECDFTSFFLLSFQVLLGNFRSFSFPTPTFELGADGGRPMAIQTVWIVVPGFMALMMVIMLKSRCSLFTTCCTR